MFLEPETKKLVESVLDAEINQDLFDQCVQQFGNLPDGLDMFMIAVSYYEQLDNYLDEEAIYFNDYWLLLDHYETQDMKLAEYRDWETDRKSTRLNSSHRSLSRMPSSA